MHGAFAELSSWDAVNTKLVAKGYTVVAAANPLRDVADLHLNAMTDPAARGERFLATGGDFVSVQDLSAPAIDRTSPATKTKSGRTSPSWRLLLQPEVLATDVLLETEGVIEADQRFFGNELTASLTINYLT